jgi:hypothetical protein
MAQQKLVPVLYLAWDADDGPRGKVFHVQVVEVAPRGAKLLIDRYAGKPHPKYINPAQASDYGVKTELVDSAQQALSEIEGDSQKDELLEKQSDTIAELQKQIAELQNAKQSPVADSPKAPEGTYEPIAEAEVSDETQAPPPAPKPKPKAKAKATPSKGAAKAKAK